MRPKRKVQWNSGRIGHGRHDRGLSRLRRSRQSNKRPRTKRGQRNQQEACEIGHGPLNARSAYFSGAASNAPIYPVTTPVWVTWAWANRRHVAIPLQLVVSPLRAAHERWRALVEPWVGSYSGRALVMNQESTARTIRPRGSAREVESLLWLAAGAAWAIVALKAWTQGRRIEARRRTFDVSNKLLGQVFPDGIKQ